MHMHVGHLEHLAKVFPKCWVVCILLRIGTTYTTVIVVQG